MRKLSRESAKIEQIPKEEFSHNIASAQFNPTALTILISLENNLDKYYRLKEQETKTEIDKIGETFEEASTLNPLQEKVFQEMFDSIKQNAPKEDTAEDKVDISGDENLLKAKELIQKAPQSYLALEHILLEISNRAFGSKPYKKKTQTLLIQRELIRQEYSEFIKYLKKYRRKLLLRSELLNKLFVELKGSMEIKEDDITLRDYFYFRDYYNAKHDFLRRNAARRKEGDS